MNGDLFFDAMDYLDEGMIEAVDALRTRKRPAIHIWRRLASAAACICILIGGVWAAGQYGRLRSTEVHDSVDQEMDCTDHYSHAFVRITVASEDQVIATIADLQKVSAVYTFLQNSIDSAIPPQYSADEKYAQASPDGTNGHPESADGAGNTLVENNTVITLITADGETRIYRFHGQLLTEEDSGKHVILTVDRLQELNEILSEK